MSQSSLDLISLRYVKQWPTLLKTNALYLHLYGSMKNFQHSWNLFILYSGRGSLNWFLEKSLKNSWMKGYLGNPKFIFWSFMCIILSCHSSQSKRKKALTKIKKLKMNMRYLMQLRQSPSILVPLAEASPCPWGSIVRNKESRYSTGQTRTSHAPFKDKSMSQRCQLLVGFCVFKLIQWDHFVNLSLK